MVKYDTFSISGFITYISLLCDSYMNQNCQDQHTILYDSLIKGPLKRPNNLVAIYTNYFSVQEVKCTYN